MTHADVVDATTVPDLTRALVSIPSHDDETAAGDAVAAWLRANTDATVRRDDAGNVLGRRAADAADPADGDQPDPTDWIAYGGGPSDCHCLAFVGHHDVVPPADDQVDADGGYVLTERDGRLYGRGTADMKGSLAAALVAFRDATPPGDRELVVASFVGEEVGGEGARAAIADGFAPEYAVVTEGSTGYSAPGVTDVAVAHKGRRGSTLVATGQAAHASEASAGENAVYRACDAVGVVRGLAAPSAHVDVLDASLTGSLVVTEIEGGSAWNVVPDRCTVTVDERTVPRGRAPLDRVEDVEGVTWRVDQDLPPMACSDAGFADAALASARAVHAESPAPSRTAAGTERGDAGDATGPDDSSGTTTATAGPAQVAKPHATDAGWLADAGVATVVVGAAEPGEAHTADESVSLAVLDRCRRLYGDLAGRSVRG